MKHLHSPSPKEPRPTQQHSAFLQEIMKEITQGFIIEESIMIQLSANQHPHHNLLTLNTTNHTNMNTEIITKTWGERNGVTLELLKSFTKQGHENLGVIHTKWAYRGDGTTSGDKQLQSLLSKDAYEHHHYDTVVSNGSLYIVVPRWKSGKQSGFNAPGLKAPYYWAMTTAYEEKPDPEAGVSEATPQEIANISEENQALLKTLPGIKYYNVAKVSFFSTNKKGKQWQEAPQDVIYFKFDAGYGCVIPLTKDFALK